MREEPTNEMLDDSITDVPLTSSRVLIALHHQVYFDVLKGIALVLKQSGRYDPVFFLANSEVASSVMLDALRAERITCLGPDGASIFQFCTPVSSISPHFLVSVKASFWRSRLQKPLNRWLISMARIAERDLPKNISVRAVMDRLRYLVNFVAVVRKVIQEWGVSILVIGQETQFYDSPVGVTAARLEGIPIVNAVMFFSPDGGEIPGTLSSWQPYSMQSWFNRAVAAIYPHWVGKHNGKRFLYLPGEDALAHEWLGMADPRPPIGESHYSDVVAVWGKKMVRHAVSCGVPREKLFVTGDMLYDEMADVLADDGRFREDLYRRLGLESGKPLLLSGFVPDRVSGREARLSDWDFQNYSELVEFWARSIASVKGYNIVTTLHPSQEYETLSYIEKWGIKIARDKTFRLIPLCDIYVTDGVSSTIPWAIACGKPVIEYDAYRWRFGTYADAGGVICVEGKDDFLSVLHRLTGDPDYYAGIAARQRLSAGDWGSLDGKSGERILRLFDRITQPDFKENI